MIVEFRGSGVICKMIELNGVTIDQSCLREIRNHAVYECLFNFSQSKLVKITPIGAHTQDTVLAGRFFIRYNPSTGSDFIDPSVIAICHSRTSIFLSLHCEMRPSHKLYFQSQSWL